MATPSHQDRLRQIAVTVSEVFCLVGSMVGVGLFGGVPVAEAAGGALSADATLVAPASGAFRIWTPIYLGLLGYTVYQWLPSQRERSRHRRIGWWVAVSMLLNALWLLSVQAGWLWVSVVVILGLAVVLGALLGRLGQDPAEALVDRLVVDVTLGLYLGWVSLASVANVTAVLVDAGVGLGSWGDQLVAVVVLAAACGLAVILSRRWGRRPSVAAAVVWGLSWIGVARLTGDPRSDLVGWAAVLLAIVLAGWTIWNALFAGRED